MTGNRQLLRLAQTGEFIISFDAAMEVQEVDYRFGINIARGDAELRCTRVNRADIGDVITLCRQQLRYLIRIFQADNVDIPGPEAIRQRFNVMPVIHRRVEPQFRFVHTINPQPAVGNLCHRHPGLELRIHLKRIGVVIQKHRQQLTGMDQHRIQFIACQHLLRPLLQRGDVRVIQGLQ